MGYLLDTNVFIAALKAHPAVRARLERTPAADLVLSPVVLGEIETGIEKSARVAHNRARLATVVEALALVPLDAAASRAYARIRADL
jgi:tRNA(fMet)-specific endonuclease VapC